MLILTFHPRTDSSKASITSLYISLARMYVVACINPCMVVFMDIRSEPCCICCCCVVRA